MKNGQYFGLISGILVMGVFYFLPEPEGLSTQAMNAAGVAALMAIWWITEAIPIFATAFVPMALFPVLKILPASETAVSYGHDLVLLLLSGFFLAKAMEKHNLHKRIALLIISKLGASKQKILFSLMLATAFISMWIANVTAALLMLPIGLAIIAKEEEGQIHNKKFGLALMLSIAYAASIGGTATLIGSPTNLIFSGVMMKMFPGAPPVGFLDWLRVGLPVVTIFLPIVWLYIVKYYKISGNLRGNREIINQELKALGKMSFSEKAVLSVFIFTAFGWIFREPLLLGNFTIPGWGDILRINDYVRDSSIGMLATLLLFALPDGNKKRLLDWKSAASIPWGVGVIVGGGYAMASSFKATGLAEWLGNQLVGIGDYPTLIVMVIIVGIILVFTELNPNTATANIFLPILASLSLAAQINPLLLMIPATFASSFVFMMPAGTGPNTVIFGSNRVSVPEMVRCGLGIKIISLIILSLVLYFLIIPLMGIERSMPPWAN